MRHTIEHILCDMVFFEAFSRMCGPVTDIYYIYTPTFMFMYPAAEAVHHACVLFHIDI